MPDLQRTANGTAGPHHDEKARLALFATWQVKDQTTAQYFGVAMAGLVIAFTLCHWLQLLFDKRISKLSTLSRHARAVQDAFQKANRAMVFGGVMFRPDRAIGTTLYCGINATLAFYDHPERVGLTIIAKRFGWLSLCNLCLTMFLALKNTPLSFLVGRSFDRLNAMHRCCGFLTILFATLHSTTYVYGLSTFGVMEQVLTEPQQYAGAVACLSMLLILATAIGFFRRRQYEVFYAIHVIMAAVVLVAVGLHRPDITKKALIITVVSASMWSVDNVVRLSRYIYHGAGNHCTLMPLAENAVRVTMHRQITAQLGSMVFLWIPGVRKFQRHPFTLISTQPATFVIQAQDGFTKALHLAACRDPGVKFRGAIEGPYCVIPDTRVYDKLVLVAGGTGATFTVAMALDWSRRYRAPEQRSTLDFIWMVRDKACLEWLDIELSELRACPGINISLYVSGKGLRSDRETEKTRIVDLSKERNNSSGLIQLSTWPGDDHEKLMYKPSSRLPAPALESLERSFTTGRPDLGSVMRHAVGALDTCDRVLVIGCGSGALLDHVRQAVDRCRIPSAPSIKVHLEQFSF